MIRQPTTQVLLVEDNPADVGLMRRLFARAGQDTWQMVQVDSLENAIKACQEYKALMQNERTFDIAFLDLSLPDSSGVETVIQFRSALPEIPIIILTGLDDEELAVQTMSAGAQDYLVKENTSIHRLGGAVRYAIERNAILKQLRASEQSSRQMLHQEQELKQLKSDFILMNAYSTYQPLTMIQAVIDLFQSNKKLSREKINECVDRVQTAADQIRHRMNDVLILSKMDSGRLRCEPSCLNLEEFCHDLAAKHQLATDNRFQIAVTTQGNCGQAEMDEDLLSYILVNLMITAMQDFSSDHAIQLNLSCSTEQAIFQIKSDRIQLSEAEACSIDPAYYQAELKLMQSTELGLALVRTCVELHQGQIQIDQTVENGITITVTLPLISKRSP
jgi:signal transduction histidine kinase